MPQARVLVSGKVQGVFYRDTTKKEADKRGVHGWVRNLRDGRVEAVFVTSDPAVLEAMVTWCHTGSPLSRVTHVERFSEVEPDDAQPSGFVIRPTAEAGTP